MEEKLVLNEENSIELSEIKLSSKGDLHIARKLWHISAGTIGLIAHFAFGASLEKIAYFSLTMALIGFTSDFLRMRSSGYNKLFIRLAKSFMRVEEKHKVTGLPFYALGAGLTLLLFNSHFALISIMFLVFADPLCSLVGNVYGTDHFLPNKSLEGTLTCFIICYAISFFYFKSIDITGKELVLFSLAGGFLGAISEMMSVLGIDDNLSLPLASGLGFSILNLAFTIV